MMAFRRSFDLLGSREMMTLDSHFKHLFLKKRPSSKEVGSIKVPDLTDVRARHVFEPKKIEYVKVSNP